MAEYEERLLTLLAEKYRKSRKNTGTNVICRRTRLAPSQLYRSYSRNDGDMEQIEAVNQAAVRCRDRGFVTLEMAGFSSEIRWIYLEDSQVKAVEPYLEAAYGYVPWLQKEREAEQLIAQYSGLSPAAGQEGEKLRKALAKHQIPAHLRQTEEVLQALAFVENNRRDLFLREASLLIYGDSKYLEENTLGPVCRALREVRGEPCPEDQMEDEILEAYHIVRERQRLCLKGPGVLELDGRRLDAAVPREGLEFFAGELDRLERIHIGASRLITVENWTAWQRLRTPDAALLYLGGYATRSQRDFLKKIRQDNPELAFLHFGDLDAGGLYIHEHLCRVTGIPFGFYRMSRRELEDPRFAACLRPLTENDRVRLRSLEKREPYRELAAWMLARNGKLEQEIVSFAEEEEGRDMP